MDTMVALDGTNCFLLLNGMNDYVFIKIIILWIKL